jgi:signal transduction histidine kinase
LAIARWIVDLHGGEITVDERRTRGCRMVIQLPAPTA